MKLNSENKSWSSKTFSGLSIPFSAGNKFLFGLEVEIDDFEGLLVFGDKWRKGEENLAFFGDGFLKQNCVQKVYLFMIFHWQIPSLFNKILIFKLFKYSNEFNKVLGRLELWATNS